MKKKDIQAELDLTKAVVKMHMKTHYPLAIVEDKVVILYPASSKLTPADFEK